MAFSCRRLYYKYVKCIIFIVIVAFFAQILIALNFFPSDSDNTVTSQVSFKNQVVGDVSARKVEPGYEDDEDLSPKKNKQHKLAQTLRLEELDFTPSCDIKSREAISAIHRAKSQLCKKEIVNKACLIQSDNFYPKELSNDCPNKGMSYGLHLGCYQDKKKLRLLSSFYGNYAATNSHETCLNICVQAGFPYAGVQYGSECFCGDVKPPATAKLDDAMCDMICPADRSRSCGGYFTMNVFETGLAKFEPQIPSSSQGVCSKELSVNIVFLLTLNGRALRQVHRLINALYRTNHYFYIHIDARQDYLHRELSALEKKFPNIKLATARFSTIWGGASLLQMLLASMKDFISLGWQWDFVINLSESDFPIKSLESLESFLCANKGLNFIKSHGREVQRFIKKQGLDKTFVECETHMWRIGERKLPRGLVVDGGSDWIALSPEFVEYIVGERDGLLAGLDTIFKHTLLPAESYFHTVVRNSVFCNTYVDNNLHVTNWKRKLGCKCQYKHVVDWCGCSPNDFRTEDWSRIQNTHDRQLFFARKFEPVVNQEIVTRVEDFIGFKDHGMINNLESYWQSIYNMKDMTASTDDVLLTHANSIVRQHVKVLKGENCKMELGDILEIHTYNEADVYKGNLILHNVLINNELRLTLETWYKPLSNLAINTENTLSDSIKIFRVSSDYDQKETMFRNFANILGPFSEPVLLYQWSSFPERKFDNLTVVWMDPAGVVADVNEMHIEENNLTNFVKSNIKLPLMPGIWKVALSDGSNLVVQTRFLISPLQYFSGKPVSAQEASMIHSGSNVSYKKFPNIKIQHFLPSQEHSVILQKLSESNSKRVDQDLLEWIDSLSIIFYSVLNTCANLSSVSLELGFSCRQLTFKDCASTSWSSLSPDPKGSIGMLNKQSGRLQRV